MVVGAYIPHDIPHDMVDLTSVFVCRGVWNVPYIASAVLMSGDWLRGLGDNLPSYSSLDIDPDMAFPQWMRTNVIAHLASYITMAVVVIYRLWKQHAALTYRPISAI